VRPDSGIESMEDLVALTESEGTSYSSSGVGSMLHLAAVFVLDEFGVKNPLEKATHIPQKGGGAAATAVLNGTATFLCTNTSALASFVANGQLKPLMVTSASSLGKPDLQQLVGWTGIAGPDDLPDAVAAKWGEWMAEAAGDEKFVEQMTARGSVIKVMSPEEANEFIQTQYDTFRALVDKLGMRIEG
jgi:tripartite-type tricarboxylate transporter receptor subunit TctC